MASELYSCETCAKTFETQGKLNRHLKVHSKPYQCKQCERGFALGADLNRHIRSRHRLATEKFACPVVSCQFTATRKDNVKQHLQNVHDLEDQSLETVPQTKDVRQEQLADDLFSQRFPPHSWSEAPNVDGRCQTYVGLYEAIALGNASLIQMMLDAGLDVNHVTEEGVSLLHCAARAGQTSMVQLLLTKGVSVISFNADETPRPALHQAILSGNPETVACLLHAGYAHTDVDELPSFLAQCESTRILYMCLSRFRERDHPDLTYRILDAAAGRGQVSVVRALLASHDLITTPSARVTASVTGSLDILPRRLNVPWRAYENYSRFFTPLHRAAAKGRLEVAQVLSRHPLNFYRRDRNYQTPLHVAARGGHASMVKVFLSVDAMDGNPPDGRKRTPLHRATEYGMSEAVSALLDHPQIRTDCLDSQDLTPLHYAGLRGVWDIADMFLKHGNNNQTPSSKAQDCQIVPYQVKKRLLEHPDFFGVKVNVVRYGGSFDREGLLHLAVRTEDCDLLQLLSDHPNIDINSKDEQGAVPALVLAVKLGQIEAVKILLRHKNIDLEITTWEGGSVGRHLTALLTARMRGHDSIVDLLLTHGAQDHDAPEQLQESEDP